MTNTMTISSLNATTTNATCFNSAPNSTLADCERAFLISRYTEHSALIFTTILVVMYLVRTYVFEKQLLAWKFGTMYTSLDETRRRGFVNHIISLLTKKLLLAWGVYPFVQVVVRNKDFTDRCYGNLTMGDVLLITMHAFCAMYVHELIYRTSVSCIGMLHHVGTVVIGQTVVTLTLREDQWNMMAWEIKLCFVMGVADLLFEACPHYVLLLHRIKPDNFRALRNYNAAACLTTLFGTALETIGVYYLYITQLMAGTWSLGFTVATPLLLTLFAVAQLHGSRIFWKYWREFDEKMREEAEPEEEKLERGNNGAEITLQPLHPLQTKCTADGHVCGRVVM